MPTTVVSAPAAEPVTLTEIKAQARIDYAYEDALLTALITAARQRVEHYLGRALITQTLETVLDVPRAPRGRLSGPIQNSADYSVSLEQFTAFGPVALPYAAPLQSVTSVWVETTPGTWTLLSSSGYVVDTSAEPGTLRFTSGLDGPRLKIRYVAGYGAAGSSVPAPIVAAIKMAVAGLANDREGGGDALTAGARALLQPYRLYRLR